MGWWALGYLEFGGPAKCSYISSKAVEVVYDHVEVLALVEVIDLEEVLSLQAERFTALQIQLDVFTLKSLRKYIITCGEKFKLKSFYMRHPRQR